MHAKGSACLNLLPGFRAAATKDDCAPGELHFSGDRQDVFPLIEAG